MQEKNLLSIIKKLQNELETELRGSQVTTAQSGDDADKATWERDCELVMKIQRRKMVYLKKVQAALDRIDNGTFGECLECGDDIELNRLSARPTATCCLKCKEEKELEEGKLSYAKKTKTNGVGIVTGGHEVRKFADGDIPGIGSAKSKQKAQELGVESLVG